MKAVAVCPICGERIPLKTKKDFESYSHIEAQRHYQARHPEVLAKYEFGMPYTPVEFDD